MEAAITLYIDPMKLDLVHGHKFFWEWVLRCTVVIQGNSHVYMLTIATVVNCKYRTHVLLESIRVHVLAHTCI
jgi:hypothetical protein